MPTIDKMSLRDYKSFSVLLIVLGIALGIFVYPDFLNRGIEKLNRDFRGFPDVPFRLGLDLKGGAELLYEADISQIEEGDIDTEMERLKSVIEKRINMFGVRESEIQRMGENRLSVQLPGIKEPEEAIKEIGKTPYLEFKEELPFEERERIIKEKLAGQIEEEEIDIEALCFNTIFITSFIQDYGQDPCFKATPLTGRYLERAELDLHPQTSKPSVGLEFDSEGGKLFEEITRRNIGKLLPIYIDNIIISAPEVQEEIRGGRAQITGKFTVQEAKDLVVNLNDGALPVRINLISQKSIGATLGMLSVQKSLKAGMIGFLAIIVFLILFYRLPGVLASIALLIYAAIVLSLFKVIPVTMTLAGIGGFILSVGMAVDANILIFSRIREERREGKEFLESVKEGFSRAWPAIRDGNLTTLLIAIILFGFGTSFIKGFATTLSIGILVSMFSAIFITRSFLIGFAKTRLEKSKWLWR